MNHANEAVAALIQVALENPIIQAYEEKVQRLIERSIDLLDEYPPEVIVYVGKMIAQEGGYRMLNKALTWEE